MSIFRFQRDRATTAPRRHWRPVVALLAVAVAAPILADIPGNPLGDALRRQDNASQAALRKQANATFKPSKAPKSGTVSVTKPKTMTIKQWQTKVAKDAAARTAREPKRVVVSPSAVIERDGKGRYHLVDTGTARYRPTTDGGWEPISTALEPVAAGPVAVNAPGLMVPTTFARDSAPSLTFDPGPSRVTLQSIGGAVVAPEISGQSVIYRDVQPSVDFIYTVAANSIKEAVLLKDAKAAHAFRFHLADPAGVLGQPQRQPNGGYRFVGGSSPALLAIPPSIAYGAKSDGTPRGDVDPTTFHHLDLGVIKSGDGWDLSLAVGSDWLATQQFPVTVDPTLTWWSWGRPGWQTTGLGPDVSGSVYVGPGWPCTPGQPATCLAFDSTNLYAGHNTAGFTGRAVIHYPYNLTNATWKNHDAPSPISLPLRAQIDTAKLSLHFNGCVAASTPAPPGDCAATGQYVDLYKLSAPVSNASTWADVNAAVGPALLNTAGQPLSARSQNPSLVYGPADQFQGTWQDFDMKTTLQDWVNDPDHAYGLVMRARNEALVPVGSRWGSNADPASTSRPFLGTWWYENTPTAPPSVTATVAASTVTSAWTESTGGTYGIWYHAGLVNAETGLVMQTQQRDLPAGDPTSWDFTNVPPGRYRVIVNSSNHADNPTSPYTSSPVVTVGNVDGGASADKMGFEPWWRFETRSVGPQATANVNVGNGNLVLEQTDSAPVQGHGQLSYVLRRTYNSQEPATIGPLGSGIGRGWTLNVSAAGDLGASLAAGLVPDTSALAPGDVVMVDRDGTRHRFTVKSAANVTVGTGTGSAFTLDPSALTSSLLGGGGAATLSAMVSSVAATVVGQSGLSLNGIRVCADTAYQAPAGVHVGLWRFLGVATATPCGTYTATSGPGGGPPVILGYATVRPDRVRQVFAGTGQLLSMFDQAGNELRYSYEFSIAGFPVNRLKAVYEPASCADPAITTCRALRFSYGFNTVAVTDPAGRVVTYTIDTDGQLVSAVTVAAGGGTLESWSYSYDPAGAICGSTTKQLCSVTAPNLRSTAFTYNGGKVASVAERFNAAEPAPTASQLTTAFTYSAGTTDAAQDGRIRRYDGIDGSLRVKDVYAGTSAELAAGNAATHTEDLWDTAGCQPEDPATPNNNLCQHTVFAGSMTYAGSPPGFVAPGNQVQHFTHTPEGKVLTETTDRAAGNLVSRYGYQTQSYIPGSSTPVSTNQLLADPYVARPRPANALFTITDRVEAIDPNGQITRWNVDDNYDQSVGKLASSCGHLDRAGNPVAANGNTGLLCHERAPENAVTSSTYDATFGQKLTETAPTNAQTAFRYFADGTLDLSGGVNAGGWLRAVVDPYTKFVAFGYDRAGNVVRTWDRNATAGLLESAFPGTLASPPNTRMTETRYAAGTAAAAFAAPWRHPLTSTTPMGEASTFDIDADGKVTGIHSPRNNLTTRTYTARDQLLTETLPATPVGTTTYAYDGAGHQLAVTDPNQHATKFVYDSAGRRTETRVSRGLWASASADEIDDCDQSTTADLPIQSSRTVCTTTTTFAGTSQPVAVTDAAGASTWTAYDTAGRPTDTWTPRDTGLWFRSQRKFDFNGNLTDDCPANQLAKEAGVVCGIGAHFSRHLLYDGLDRPAAMTAYREQIGADGKKFLPTTWSTLTTAIAYDFAARKVTTTDPNGKVTVEDYDLNDRKADVVSPRNAAHPTVTTTFTLDPVGNTTAKSVAFTGSSPVSITAYRYDAANRLVDSVEAAESTLAAAASNSYLPATAPAPKNIRTRRLYDTDGNMVGVYESRAFLGATGVTNPDARYLSRVDYDANNRPMAQWSPYYDNVAATPLGTGAEQAQCPVTSGGYAPAVVAGVPVYPTGVGVCVARATYNAGANLIKLTNPTSTEAGGTNRFRAMTWTDDNLLSSVTSANPAGTGQVTVAAYLRDGPGRTTRTSDAALYATDTVYFADGLARTVSGHANGSGTIDHQQTATYSPVGLPETVATFIESGRTDTSTFAYYADTLRHEILSPSGLANRYGYDSTGNPTQVWSPSASPDSPAGDNNTANAPVKNTFTGDNLLDTTIEPVTVDGSVRRFNQYDYDPAGRKLSQAVKEILGTDPATTYLVDGPPKTQSFAYAANGWPTAETGWGGEQIQTTYAANGEAASVVDVSNQATTNNSYFLNGWLRTSQSQLTKLPTPPPDKWSGLRYAGDGVLIARMQSATASFASPEVTQTYGYNDARLPTTTTATGWGFTGDNYTTTYDGVGRPDKRTDPQGRVTRWSWRADSVLLSKTLYASSAETTVDDAFAYPTLDIDGLGRPKTATRSKTGGTPEQFSYAYNTDGRVSSFNGQAVSYDPDGNRTSFNGAAATYRADGSRALPATYDAQGRQTTDPCNALTIFDGFDRLRSSTSNGACGAGAVTTFDYDGLGRQVRVTPAAPAPARVVRYSGSTSTAVSEETSGTSTTARYLLSGDGLPLAVADGQATPVKQTLHDDGRGTVVATTGMAGIACLARFDPWGNPISPASATNPCTGSGSSPNGLWWQSARRDQSTGTYTFGTRTYDPRGASWLSADTYRSGSSAAELSLRVDPLTANRYRYVNGDPVNLVDPSGHRLSVGLGGGPIVDFSPLALNNVKLANCGVATYMNSGIATLSCARPQQHGLVADFARGSLQLAAEDPVLFLVTTAVVITTLVVAAGPEAAAGLVAIVSDFFAGLARLLTSKEAAPVVDDAVATGGAEVGAAEAGVSVAAGEAPTSGPASLVRIVGADAPQAELFNELKARTFESGQEHALARLSSGEHAIFSGGETGIHGLDVEELLAHTHPYQLPAQGVSVADYTMLNQLGQYSSILLEHGAEIPFTMLDPGYLKLFEGGM